MKDKIARWMLGVVAVLLAVNLTRTAEQEIEAQSSAQYKVVMFDPKNFVDQSERIADVCNSEARAGWQFVSMGSVVSTSYLVFRR
jgi:hypothetical protein